MSDSLSLIIILSVTIVFIVIATSRYKLHPFITLLLAAYGMAFATGMEPASIGALISKGFGGMLEYIGIIILLGTMIGVILEKTGAAITMANSVIRVLGSRFPGLTMSIIGYIVSIPVFCDSGFIILSSLRKSLTRKLNYSSVTMTVALATGLYASHTFVPPTPGPIAAAGNLGLNDQLGLVIFFGLIVSSTAVLAGYFWAVYVGKKYHSLEDDEHFDEAAYEQEMKKYGDLPSEFKSFAPIFIPILLIALGSVATFPGYPLGEGLLFKILEFLGKPINALFIGLFFAMSLLPAWNKTTLGDWMEEGIKNAASIIMITGAGGAFGAVLKATQIGDSIGALLQDHNIGIFLPFIIAAAFKTAQGSSTVALVATSALIAPMLPTLGLDSTYGRVLAVMATGAGAMTVSHANDSFFWVVTRFGGLDVATAYKTQTMATLLQGLTAMATITLISWIIL